jgi:DNA invertase Pin-like site-specific DNA recombinase
VSDKVTDEDVRRLLERYRSGVTARKLVEEFGISESSVKRLLRKHGARRKDRG